MGRLKVLMSAYACQPARGSEEAVGWNTAREVSKYCEVWVMTRTLNRPSIEAEISQDPTPELHFVYCDLPRWLGRWARGQILEWHLYYYVWQIYIYFVAKRMHRNIGFDIVHHV